MNYLIDTQSQLDELAPLLTQLSEQKELTGFKAVVAVDTEFFREKTYNAKLCLVQLGIGDNQYCIDVLTIDDLSLLKDLFADENILKLFHAARQDLEVILQTLDVMVKPIFDTQLAAAFCGSDMQIGYGGLVLDRLGVDLPKSQSRTDWTRRPLTDEQIEYAGDDVAYLHQLYEKALEELSANDKMDWYLAEVDGYYDESKYNVIPEQAYKRLSGGGLRIQQQYVLKALAQWREEAAQKRDIPRTWILRDDKLFDLAAKRPKTEKEIVDMEVFGKKSVKYFAPETAKLIANVEVGEDRLWRKTEPLTKEEKQLCTKMMKKVAAYAKEYDVAQALIGTRKDVESLYRNRSSKKLLRGWREDLVGRPLLEYLRSENV